MPLFFWYPTSQTIKHLWQSEKQETELKSSSNFTLYHILICFFYSFFKSVRCFDGLRIVSEHNDYLLRYLVLLSVDARDKASLGLKTKSSSILSFVFKSSGRACGSHISEPHMSFWKPHYISLETLIRTMTSFKSFSSWICSIYVRATYEPSKSSCSAIYFTKSLSFPCTFTSETCYPLKISVICWMIFNYKYFQNDDDKNIKWRVISDESFTGMSIGIVEHEPYFIKNRRWNVWLVGESVSPVFIYQPNKNTGVLD